MNDAELGLLVLMPVLAAVVMALIREVRSGIVWSAFGCLAVLAVAGGLVLQRGEALVNGPLVEILFLVVVPLGVCLAICRIEAVRRNALATFLAAPFATLAGVVIGLVLGVNGGLMQP